jgi:hypothetical protein
MSLTLLKIKGEPKSSSRDRKRGRGIERSGRSRFGNSAIPPRRVPMGVGRRGAGERCASIVRQRVPNDEVETSVSRFGELKVLWRETIREYFRLDFRKTKFRQSMQKSGCGPLLFV